MQQLFDGALGATAIETYRMPNASSLRHANKFEQYPQRPFEVINRLPSAIASRQNNNTQVSREHAAHSRTRTWRADGTRADSEWLLLADDVKRIRSLMSSH